MALSIRLIIFWLCSSLILLCYLNAPARPQPPPPGTYQYFRETTFNTKRRTIGAQNKCDDRFAPEEALTEDDTRQTLLALLDSYMATMRHLGVSTWVAHGALIGYYWNGHLLPWDTDIDAQMTVDSLDVLATQYIKTSYNHTVSEIKAS